MRDSQRFSEILQNAEILSFFVEKNKTKMKRREVCFLEGRVEGAAFVNAVTSFLGRGWGLFLGDGWGNHS